MEELIIPIEFKGCTEDSDLDMDIMVKGTCTELNFNTHINAASQIQLQHSHMLLPK